MPLYWEGWVCAVQSALACQPIRPVGQIRLTESHKRHPEVANRILVALEGVNHNLLCPQFAVQADNSLVWKDLTHRRGVLFPWALAQLCRYLTISNLELDMGGSTRGGSRPDWRTMRRRWIEVSLVGKRLTCSGCCFYFRTPPSCLSYLSIGRPTEVLGQPSRSVRQSWSVGEAGFCSERCRQSVPRSGARESTNVMVVAFSKLRKELTCSELVGPRSRGRLVVRRPVWRHRCRQSHGSSSPGSNAPVPGDSRSVGVQECDTAVPTGCSVQFCHGQRARNSDRFCRHPGCEARVPPECTTFFAKQMNRPRCSTAECDSPPAPGCLVGACVVHCDHWQCSRARIGHGRNSRRNHVLSNVCRDPSCCERVHPECKSRR